MTKVDSPAPLMHHDPDRSWITDPDPDHPKGKQPYIRWWVGFMPVAIQRTKAKVKFNAQLSCIVKQVSLLFYDQREFFSEIGAYG